MGDVRVPADALYAAETQRARENFKISGLRFPRSFIRALGIIKAAAAEANRDKGLLPAEVAAVIIQASEEVADGRWDDQFPLDIFQTGSGTSTNMNANEVIATRAMQLIKDGGRHDLIHPHDHVNRSQSSNDVIPSAIYISASLEIQENLLPAIRQLRAVMEMRAAELADTVKTGRTHLMDALPVTFGQEIGGWASLMGMACERVQSSLPGLLRLAIGGTAVGSGINAPEGFGAAVCGRLAHYTGLPFAETSDHFAAQSDMSAAAEMSGHLKTTATSIIKIANDLRLMNSGPLSGMAEIVLPALQPGSSIMPGKVNPVECEAVIMAGVQVMANDLAVTIGNSRGEFQLNVLLPLICHNLLQSITLLSNASLTLADKVIAVFSINAERHGSRTGTNAMLVTALTPRIGYDRAVEIVKRASAEGRTVRQMAEELTDISPEELDRLLDPLRLAGRR